MKAKSIRLYDSGGSEGTLWFEISKIAMNKHQFFKENDIIVGYLETADDQTRFKLRKPAQFISHDVKEKREDKKLDTRLISRGIVCDTKNKNTLLKIISELGISQSKLDKNDIRIKRLCEIIKNKLIDNEIRERGKDSKWKYLYGWYDEMVILG